LQKIAIILLIFLMNTGCSFFLNQERRNIPLSENSTIVNLSERIKNHDISNANFFIEKADVKFSGPEGTQKFLASLKFIRPDTYLISLKGATGIEALRIYLSGDSILINDRINKKLYTGNSQYIKKKFGFPVSFIPLIFGDYISTNRSDDIEVKCKDGKLGLTEGISGLNIKYVMDCNKAKAVSIGVENSLNQLGIQISYDKFFEKGNCLQAKIINIIDNQRHTSISIDIDKIQLPWEGKIEFIPGNRYELVQLL